MSEHEKAIEVAHQILSKYPRKTVEAAISAYLAERGWGVSDDDVVNAPPPRFSPERPYGVKIIDDPLPVFVSPPTPSSNALEIEWKAEAFDMIVAARKKHIDAIAAYNARRELSNAERRRGNWTIKLDAEYHAMNDAQVELYSTVQDACSAAISQEGEKK